MGWGGRGRGAGGGKGGGQQTRPEKLLHWRCPLSFVYRGEGVCFVLLLFFPSPQNSCTLRHRTDTRKLGWKLHRQITELNKSAKANYSFDGQWYTAILAQAICTVIIAQAICPVIIAQAIYTVIIAQAICTVIKAQAMSCYNSTGNLSCYNSTGNLCGICRESRGNQLLITIFH